MSVFVVVNPSAGSGRARKAWPGLRQRLEASFGDVDVAETKGTGHAISLVRDGIVAGATTVIAIGGDGTINEAVNGIAAANAFDGVTFAPITVGRGSDLARSITPGRTMEAMLDAACGNGVRRIDLGRISFVADDGQPMVRYFDNIASFGLSGAIDRRVNARRLPYVPGEAHFLGATVAAFFTYRPQSVRIALDEQPPFDVDIAMVAVANGRYFGGGMMIAPDAEMDDGLFDVVILRASPKLILLRDLQKVYGGRHRDHPAITIARARRVSVTPLGNQPVLLDIDGESPGRLKATFEVVPRLLQLRVAGQPAGM